MQARSPGHDRPGTDAQWESRSGRTGQSSNRPDRGVSTVVDATLALLLISAAAVLLGTALSTDRNRLDPGAADRVAGTLSATTVHVDYSLAGVRGDPAFPAGDYDGDRFQRQHYGSLPAVLADATIRNATVEGRPLTGEGTPYVAVLEGQVLETLAGVGYDASVVAVWRPYENASIAGRLRIGPRPPGDADVGTALLRVPSGIDLEGQAVQAAYDRLGRYEDAADVLADAIVERYFGPPATQRALEGQRLARALAVYRYRQVAAAIDAAGGPTVTFDPGDPADPLSRAGANPATPNASAANAALADALSAVIEADLRATFSRHEMATELADAVHAGRVRIAIQVWES